MIYYITDTKKKKNVCCVSRSFAHFGCKGGLLKNSRQLTLIIGINNEGYLLFPIKCAEIISKNFWQWLIQYTVLHPYYLPCCPEERWDDFEDLFTASMWWHMWHTIISIESAYCDLMLWQGALKAVITLCIYTCGHYRNISFCSPFKHGCRLLQYFCNAHVYLQQLFIFSWQKNMNVSNLLRLHRNLRSCFGCLFWLNGWQLHHL